MPSTDLEPDADHDEEPDELVAAFRDYFTRSEGARGDTKEFVQQYTAGQERSLDLDVQDFATFDADAADALVNQPAETLAQAKRGLYRAYPKVKEGSGRLYVRPKNLSETRTFRIGKYRRQHLDELISVRGRIVGVDDTQPYAEKAAFRCMGRNCGEVIEMNQRYGKMIEPSECPNPECENTKSWKLDVGESDLKDWQSIGLHPVGTNMEDPPSLTVHLFEDLTGKVKQGQEMVVTGIYTPFPTQDENTIDCYLKAKGMDLGEQVGADALDAEEIRERTIDYVRDNQRDGGFGVEREEVIAHVASKGAQEDDVREAIEEGVEDRSCILDTAGSRLTALD